MLRVQTRQKFLTEAACTCREHSSHFGDFSVRFDFLIFRCSSFDILEGCFE